MGGNSTEEINSIDDAEELLDTSMEHEPKDLITPTEEFFGHCSNLQVLYSILI